MPMPASNFVFALPNSEFYFHDSDPFSLLLRVRPVFKESKNQKVAKQLIELRLIAKEDMNDAHKRRHKRHNQHAPIIKEGELLKQGKKLWKKRYFILQDFTLFYYRTEADASSGTEAQAVWPMGACYVINNYAYDGSKKDDAGAKKFYFSLDLEVLGQRKLNFCARTRQDAAEWIEAFDKICMRRVKTTISLCCEEIIQKNFLLTEGIFRVGANNMDKRAAVEKFEQGRLDVRGLDEHVLSAMIKHVLRSMPNPLLTHGLYTGLTALSEIRVVAKQLEKLKALLLTLPSTNFALFGYLVEFLHKVSSHADKNKMSASNLAIVVAPNILRPRVEDAEDQILNTRQTPKVVQMAIENLHYIWGDGAPQNVMMTAVSGASLLSDDERRSRLSNAPLPSVPAMLSVHSTLPVNFELPLTGTPHASSHQISLAVNKNCIAPPARPPGSPPNRHGRSRRALEAEVARVKDWEGVTKLNRDDWKEALETREAELFEAWKSCMQQISEGPITPEIEVGVDALLNIEDRWRFMALKKIQSEVVAIKRFQEQMVLDRDAAAEQERIRAEAKAMQNQKRRDSAPSSLNRSISNVSAPPPNEHIFMDKPEVDYNSINRTPNDLTTDQIPPKPPPPATVQGGDDNGAQVEAPPPPSIPTMPQMPQMPTLPDSLPDHLSSVPSETQKRWCEVVYPRQPDCDDELLLVEGERIQILDSSDAEGWWEGVKHDGSRGLFPYNFVVLAES
eukprot:CAMPEP_0175125228 /NCGR_PEP_ID=MMETSP0087-20121206/3202_1 /TAXON_ID=136419 /ORGANISM="Unknown Unknown, Strain D1" /LENGTH=731 /DNA_ID=CAMNT_0016407047 /DNA_START=64 /DNA_END=2259 /DNA_ORIENTATION=-